MTVSGLVLTVTAPAAYTGSQFTFDYTVTDPSNLTATATRDDHRHRHPAHDDHHTTTTPTTTPTAPECRPQR